MYYMYLIMKYRLVIGRYNMLYIYEIQGLVLQGREGGVRSGEGMGHPNDNIKPHLTT